MKRPRSTSTVAPSPGQPPSTGPATTPEATPVPPPLWRETAPIVAAVLAALDVVETAPRSGPAAKAYRSVLRREGEAAVALGGPEAMAAVLQQILKVEPEKAKTRRVILGMAWSDLPGWRS